MAGELTIGTMFFGAVLGVLTEVMKKQSCSQDPTNCEVDLSISLAAGILAGAFVGTILECAGFSDEEDYTCESLRF